MIKPMGFFDIAEEPMLLDVDPEVLHQIEAVFSKCRFNPAKIEQINLSYSSENCRYVRAYSCGLRKTESMSDDVKGLTVWKERPEITTTDGYHWHGGVMYALADDTRVWVLLPTHHTGTVDRHILFFANHPLEPTQLAVVTDRLTYTFQKLSEDRWYDFMLSNIDPGGRKKIIFTVKNTHPAEPPTRDVIKKVRELTSSTVRLLGIGTQTCDKLAFLVLGDNEDVPKLQAAGFDEELY